MLVLNLYKGGGVSAVGKFELLFFGFDDSNKFGWFELRGIWRDYAIRCPDGRVGSGANTMVAPSVFAVPVGASIEVGEVVFHMSRNGLAAKLAIEAPREIVFERFGNNKKAAFRR